MRVFDSGIYCLRNTKTGECYVGRAKRLGRREKGHFSALERGVHLNKRIQASYDAHGREAFVFEVLERSTTHYLSIEEREWIIKLRPAFNVLVPWVKLPRRQPETRRLPWRVRAMIEAAKA